MTYQYRSYKMLYSKKNDPFINQVKIFINKHFQESEFLWGKVSNPLKKRYSRYTYRR